MKKKIVQKLRSKAGDSIAEVLIALLISSLALVMLASMISASSNMVMQSQSRIDTYYKDLNTLNKMSGTTSSNVSSNPGMVTVRTGTGITSTSDTVSVSLYVFNNGNDSIITYK